MPKEEQILEHSLTTSTTLTPRTDEVDRVHCDTQAISNANGKLHPMLMHIGTTHLNDSESAAASARAELCMRERKGTLQDLYDDLDWSILGEKAAEAAASEQEDDRREDPPDPSGDIHSEPSEGNSRCRSKRSFAEEPDLVEEKSKSQLDFAGLD